MVDVNGKAAAPQKTETLELADWLRYLEHRYSQDQAKRISKACELAKSAHQGQKRVSGEPYFSHVLAVAKILSGLKLDPDTIVAAILHDVVEDTPVSLEDIREDFGPEVAQLVNGVTKMGKMEGLQSSETGRRSDQIRAESLRKMLLAMAEDVRVVLIKLADRLHNMRTLESLAVDKQRRISQETMDVFAPLANRLGIWQIKWELEDLSYRYLEPENYQDIADMLVEKRVDREKYIEKFKATLAEKLEQAKVKAEISGRPKHIYGIAKKMHQKSIAFDQVYDVRAVRILVENTEDCYSVLGIIHSNWQYIPGEFDDYIATPKENNYQSIHTAVVGPEGQTVEVQIRTREMHKQSEYGVAAHWRYKEGALKDKDYDEKIAWLRQLLEWKDELIEAGEFVDQFKSEVFSDRVYVFTPKGKIIDLQNGSTPLDFAYRIHTEVGHRCRGAKINGRIQPLIYQLKTGDNVEILTVKKGEPSRDWLNPHLSYIKTSKARSKIQQWFRQQDHDDNVASGRVALERELKRLGISGLKQESIAKHLRYKGVNDFLAAVGRGEVKATRILDAVQRLTQEDIKVEQAVKPDASRLQRTQARGVQIQGVGDLLVHMAKCCKPLPGDPVVGYITHGRGVTIHRKDCANALRYFSDSIERLVEVSWGSSSDDTYPVDISVTAYDRSGLLSDITTLLRDEGINVRAINTSTDKEQHVAYMRITLEIPDINKLSRILVRIEQLSNVIEVSRYTG